MKLLILEKLQKEKSWYRVQIKNTGSGDLIISKALLDYGYSINIQEIIKLEILIFWKLHLIVKEDRENKQEN